jgi:diguanylate cyclase (GGDEF)-like protein
MSLGSFRSLFSVPAENPELIRSQLAALSRQIPLLYFILLVSAAGLAATHLGSAPPLLTVSLPSALALVCIARFIFWRRIWRSTFDDAEAVRRLRVTVKLVAILGFAFTGWALSLYFYGDAYAQGHVAFFMSITVIGCIFCLMHLRPAALMLTLIVVMPFTLFFALSGHTVFVAIAANVLLVTGAMVFMLFTYYRDFATLIDSQKELLAKQQETQRLSDENFRLANLDSLMELPNRRQFFAVLDALLARVEGSGGSFALALVDLDDFKPVNDIYGHAVGDRVLIEAGRRLSRLAAPGVTLARLGGDEFGLLIELPMAGSTLLEFGRLVCDTLERPYVIPDCTAQLSGSIGFALYPDAGRTASQLFERADYALYYAKENRRGSAVIFSEEHETEIHEISRIEQGLRHADLEAELSLDFQPIFDVDSDCTTGFEALARWTSPTLGRVAPATFIKVAERSDLINRLTEILLRKALATAAGWPEDWLVSFNLSMRDVASPEAIARIAEIVMVSGVRPGRIDLEITETAVMRDFDQASDALRALKRLGVNLSLDDFGTGYSSLSYVYRLPLDKIKIDRSFVGGIETDPACRSIVKTVVDLCRNLRLGCVVEGIETPAQLRILQELGCSTMQGYFFGLPQPTAQPPERSAAARQADLIEGV